MDHGKEEILNITRDWGEVGRIPTGSGTVSDAFRQDFGPPTKDLLPIGMWLYRFSSHQTLAQGTVTPDSPLPPWWSPLDEYKQDGGLEGRRRCAARFSVTLREWARLTSVIKENWSSLACIHFVVLAKPVYAWHGPFKSMGRVDAAEASLMDASVEGKGSSRNLPGGGTQFYIPGLKAGHVDKFRIENI